MWKAVLWAQAAALCLACLVAWLIERAQPGDQSANARASGGNWLRTREHFARTSAGGNESQVPATGWARETLSHSLRAERTRAVLPAAWPLLLGFTRWALLAVFVLPAAALWVSAAPAPRLGVQSAVFLVAATIAVVTLLLARWRVRGRGAFALILCSGLGVATPLLALARDALAQSDSPPTNAAQPAAIWQEGAPWLSRSLLREDAPNALAAAGVHLSAFDAGYLAGAMLVCATALVMGQQMARRALFDRPPIEIRHVHPLSLPLPQDVRARLHWALFCLPIALALSLRSWGDAPGIAAMLALAGALCLGGWRFKVLGTRQFASALAFALTASLALWMVWLASGGTLVGATGGIGSGTTANRAHRDVAIPSMRGATTLSGGLIPGGATGTGTIGKPTRHDSPALEAQAAIRRLSQMPTLWLRRAIAHAPFWCSALVLLGLVLWLLKRPPTHLWSILSLAPAWGWMLLGGASALALSPLMLASGQIVAVALGMALLPAFFFVWLERA